MISDLNHRLVDVLNHFDRWDYNQKDLCINLSVHNNGKLSVVAKLFVWDLIDFAKMNLRDKNGKIK